MALPFEQLRTRLPNVLPRNMAGRLIGIGAAGAIVGGFFLTAFSLRETTPRVIGTVEGAGGLSRPAAVPVAPSANVGNDAFTDRRALVAPAAPAVVAAPAPTPPPQAPTPPPAATAAAAPAVQTAPAPAAPAAPAASGFTMPSAAPTPAAPTAAPVVAATATPPATAPAPRFAPHSGCGQATVSVTPREAGIMGLRIESSCRAGEFMQIRYGGIDLIRRIGDTGVLYVDLDLFAGTSQPVEMMFHDATRRAVPAVAKDMDRVSKVAVIWKSPINLDIHAFEYAAAYGEAGHRWGKVTTDAATTMARVKETNRGQGFVSTADDGTGAGIHLEVYTYVHTDNDPPGSVAMAIDYETRGDVPAGDVCGTGQLANIGYEFRVLSRDGQTAGGNGTIRSAGCGVQLPQAIRYQQAGLPTLRIRKP